MFVLVVIRVLLIVDSWIAAAAGRDPTASRTFCAPLRRFKNTSMVLVQFGRIVLVHFLVDVLLHQSWWYGWPGLGPTSTHLNYWYSYMLDC